MAKGFCLSIHAFLCEIDEPHTKATPKMSLTIATNAAQLGFDWTNIASKAERRKGVDNHVFDELY